jgi:hypothetical protein
MDEERSRQAEPRDPDLRRINLIGLGVLLLFAAFAYFLWSHPDYMPACNSGGKVRCPHAAPHAPLR